MKSILILIFSFAVITVSAQNNSKELLKSAIIKAIDTSKKDWLDGARAVLAIPTGAPADSIKKDGNLIFLYFGNYKITLDNNEDYLFYLRKAVEYKERELRYQNRRDVWDNLQRSRSASPYYQTPDQLDRPQRQW